METAAAKNAALPAIANKPRRAQARQALLLPALKHPEVPVCQCFDGARECQSASS